MPTPIAIIAGVGAGTGASIARRFAKSYPVVCLSRSPGSYEPLVAEINSAGGRAVGFSADVADSSSVKGAFEKIRAEFDDNAVCAAAVFNASGGFMRKPFLEIPEEVFVTAMSVSAFGAFNFSQAALPLLLGSMSDRHSPTLIFTGATASIKSNAMMSSFSTGKWALRALSQSLGKEFGPRGVHVVHAVMDGLIDTPATKEYMNDASPDEKLQPDAIAEGYWHLHTQARSCWTNEIEFRPYSEKW